jgi:hypothetical protein
MYALLRGKGDEKTGSLVVSMNLLDQPIKSSFGQRASPVHVSDTIVDELGSGKLRQAKPYQCSIHKHGLCKFLIL